MSKLQSIIIISICGLLGACASQKTKTSVAKIPVADKSASVVELEQRRKMREEKKQDQKDQALLLKRKSDIQGFQAKANPQDKKLRIELDSKSSVNLTDAQLYSQLVARYEKNDEIGFQSRFQMMMSRYPQSALADDALYLAGLQQVSVKNYGLALKYFNRIIRQYPYSNKTVSALFGKGAVYRKMNLDPMAKDVFKKVAGRYPSSPEALRAQAELRLLK